MNDTSKEDLKNYRKIIIKEPHIATSNDHDKLKYVNVQSILQQINSQHTNQIENKSKGPSSVHQ